MYTSGDAHAHKCPIRYRTHAYITSALLYTFPLAQTNTQPGAEDLRLRSGT